MFCTRYLIFLITCAPLSNMLSRYPGTHAVPRSKYSVLPTEPLINGVICFSLVGPGVHPGIECNSVYQGKSFNIGFVCITLLVVEIGFNEAKMTRRHLDISISIIEQHATPLAGVTVVIPRCVFC